MQGTIAMKMGQERLDYLESVRHEYTKTDKDYYKAIIKKYDSK